MIQSKGDMMRSKIGALVMTVGFQAIDNMMRFDMHPLDPEHLEACHRCIKAGTSDPKCERFVQCILGEDQTANYVKETTPMLEKLVKELFK